jgi:nucleotide-binding universal stress UspA family protein
MKLIMAGTDGSACADRAIDMASTWPSHRGEAARHNRQDTFAENEVKKLAQAEGGVGEAFELIANRVLQQAKKRARRHGVPSVEVRFGWVDAAHSHRDGAEPEGDSDHRTAS